MPFVVGGFAGLVYSVDFNKTNYNRLNIAYGASVKGQPHEFEGQTTDAIKRQRDLYNKNLQLTYVGFVGLYALTALDAYVDAHLKNFDISDDLSLNITTVTQGGFASSVSPGLGLVWQLGN